MNPLYHDAIERRLAVPLQEGPDKVTTLAEAVRRHVHAGDTVYLGSAHGRPNPLVRELVRQWWGKRPAFSHPAPLRGADRGRAGPGPPLRPPPVLPGRVEVALTATP